MRADVSGGGWAVGGYFRRGGLGSVLKASCQGVVKFCEHGDDLGGFRA